MYSALFNRAPIDPPTWPVKDIVYVSIVGSIMLAALLEWILWLLAFLFCLAKVVQKAENWSVRVLALANMAFFVAMRCIFLPIVVVTLPLPQQVVRVFPEDVVGVLQWVCLQGRCYDFVSGIPLVGWLTLNSMFSLRDMFSHTDALSPFARPSEQFGH